MKTISLAEISIFIFIGIGSWILSFVWLGWVGNAAVTLWAKSRGLTMKTPSRDMILHLFSFLGGALPFAPAALIQFFMLYTEQRSKKTPESLELATASVTPTDEARPAA